MTIYPPYFSRTSCATPSRPSCLADHSSSHRLDAHIRLTESRSIPCHQVRPKRRRRSIWAPHGIKCERDESHGLLTPGYPMGQKKGLKRCISFVDTPQRKRVKVAHSTYIHNATIASTNGPGVPPNTAHFHPDIQHHTTRLSERQHFMLWIAHMVLIYVVRVHAEDWPRPSIPCDVVNAFANDVEAVMSEFRLPNDQGIREIVVLHCLWYLQKLSPKGFIDIEDLSSKDGLLGARRLLLLAYTCTAKWLVDYASVPLRHYLPCYGKGFTLSEVNKLEMFALKAFDHSLVVKPAQLDDFRSALAEFSSRIDILDPLYDTHRTMTKILRELSLSTPNPGMQERQGIRPSSFYICRVHATLLTGLDNLLKKFTPEHLESFTADRIADRQARGWNPQPYTPSHYYPTPYPEDSRSCFNYEDTSFYHKRPLRSHNVRPRPYPSIRQ